MKDNFDRRHKTFSNEVLEWIMQKRGMYASDPLERLIAKEEETERNKTKELSEQLHKEHKMQLKKLMKNLSQSDKYIIHSYFWKGHTLAQIAKHLGYKTPSAVWKRKKKILKRLKSGTQL